MHRGAFCQLTFRWIYYYGSNKSTRKETDKTHLCALAWNFAVNLQCHFVRLSYKRFIMPKLYVANCLLFWNSFFTIRTLRQLVFDFFQVHPFTRVANVVADHDDLLTQWRNIKMSKFSTNIYFIRTTSNYFWALEVFKNQRFKSHLFSFSQYKKKSGIENMS